MSYQVAIFDHAHVPFALVRTSEGSMERAFGAAQRRGLCAAVADLYGILPVAFLVKEANGYKFDAPLDLLDAVGMVVEDLASRHIDWRPIKLLPRTPAGEPQLAA